MVEVRRIRVDEAALVRDLVRGAAKQLAQRYPEDRIGISERGLSNLETQFRLGAVHGDEMTLVALDGADIVGFICGWVTRGRATPGVLGEIDWLWARPGPTRDSLERRLAEAAIRWLREVGAGPVFVMQDARHLNWEPWESLGFEADVIRFSRYE